MADGLLTRLLRFAVAETRVDRIYAFDTEGTLVEYVLLDRPDAPAPEITAYMRGLIKQAQDSGEMIMSNNTFINPAEAPNTNTNIQNLRIYVVMPVKNYGALFFDQPIRGGVVPRPTIDKLFALCQRAALASTPDSLTDAQVQELYAGA